MPAIANAATARRYITAAKDAEKDPLQQAFGKLPGHDRLKQAMADQKTGPANPKDPAKGPVVKDAK